MCSSVKFFISCNSCFYDYALYLFLDNRNLKSIVFVLSTPLYWLTTVINIVFFNKTCSLFVIIVSHKDLIMYISKKR